jgi:preprotein translocase subunit SecG
MNTLLITFHVIVCIVIIFMVLLQVGRGAEAGAMFGGSGQAQAMRGQSTFIGKFTTAMAIAFMLTSFLLTYDTSSKAKSSVVETIAEEEVQTQPLATEAEPVPPAEQPAE